MQQSIICILDILGTKGIWTEQVVDKYFDVIKKVEIALSQAKDHLQKAVGRKLELDYNTFSDTLILTIVNTQPYNYFFDEIIAGFSQMILGIFQLYFSESFFVRGAISYGDIEKRGNHFLGPAVDDAGEYFELQDMIGICFTPKATIAVDYAIDWNLKCCNKKIDDYLIKYKTPLKNKMELELYQINWAKHFTEPLFGHPGMTPLSKISRFLSVRNIPLAATSKFTNTIKFFDVATKNYG